MIFFHLNFKFKIFRVQVNNFRLNINKLWIEDYMKISKECGIKFYGCLFLKKPKLKIYNQEIDEFS